MEDVPLSKTSDHSRAGRLTLRLRPSVTAHWCAVRPVGTSQPGAIGDPRHQFAIACTSVVSDESAHSIRSSTYGERGSLIGCHERRLATTCDSSRTSAGQSPSAPTSGFSKLRGRLAIVQPEFFRPRTERSVRSRRLPEPIEVTPAAWVVERDADDPYDPHWARGVVERRVHFSLLCIYATGATAGASARRRADQVWRSLEGKPSALKLLLVSPDLRGLVKPFSGRTRYDRHGEAEDNHHFLKAQKWPRRVRLTPGHSSLVGGNTGFCHEAAQRIVSGGRLAVADWPGVGFALAISAAAACHP
jgi:hypothetical protein